MAKAACERLSGEQGARAFAPADRDTMLLAIKAMAERATPMTGARTVEEASRRAQAYGEVIVRAMELELGALTGEVDPRFLTTLWTQAAVEDPPQKGESIYEA